MLVMPAEAPVTIPLVEPIVAIEGRLLIKKPPGKASASVVVYPLHTILEPVMLGGSGLTVSTLVV
jgi:hypothetical protein